MRLMVLAAGAAVLALGCGGDTGSACGPRPGCSAEECNTDCGGYGSCTLYHCDEATGEWNDAIICDCNFGTADAGLGACDYVSQRGCEPGDKCAFVLDDPATGRVHNACVPDGTESLGASCTEASAAGDADDCRAGGHCLGGECREICGPGDRSCDGGETCVRLHTVHGGWFNVELCLPECELLKQDCRDGEACYYVGAPVCLRPGTAAPGSSCTAVDDCAPGALCLGNGDTAQCYPLCGPWLPCWGDDNLPIACGCGATAACAAGEICWPFGFDGEPADDIAGICAADDLVGCDCEADPICPPN